jgi:hypothetical protein
MGVEHPTERLGAKGEDKIRKYDKILTSNQILWRKRNENGICIRDWG